MGHPYQGYVSHNQRVDYQVIMWIEHDRTTMGNGGYTKKNSFPIGKAEDAAKTYQTFAEMNCVKHTLW